MAVRELEGGAAEVWLRERALLARLHGAAVDEDDAALLQRLDGRRHGGDAEADSHQRLFPAHVLRAWRRLDELQVELMARTLEERALRQHAQVLAARQHREAEQPLVQIQPVRGAI